MTGKWQVCDVGMDVTIPSPVLFSPCLMNESSHYEFLLTLMVELLVLLHNLDTLCCLKVLSSFS